MTRKSLREAPLEFRSSLDQGQEERERDTLNLLPYGEALAEFIHACETPMTIGIQGDWGIGKTSLMNMLRGIESDDVSGLLDGDRCRIVSLETWPFSQFHDHNELVIACLQSLTGKVAAALEGTDTDSEAVRKSAKKAQKKLRKALRKASSGDALSMVDEDAGEGDLDDISGLMGAFHASLKEMVQTWVEGRPDRRIVIFVDDLDRVPPDESLLLLEGFKHFVEIPGCVFVMAIDYDVVQQGMAEKFGPQMQRTKGKAFYDKIIQLPFVMPAASYQLERYIVGLMLRSGFPFSKELVEDPDSRDYLTNITLCTVGRNPRNIKRVMNYATLLDHVRERQGGEPLDRRDALILYGLICMQIAWPELYVHFVNDPTVDTVTSLQNWEFLDRLPEMARLFERELDREKVKINIGTYFDTLFSLLDENHDGQIDSKELRPVLDVMSLASMTAVDARERPRDWFIRRVRENNEAQDPLVESFLDRVFMRSIWYLGSECRYRKSGTRYVTIVHQGRQIGSLVSLRNQPFVFRLALPPEKVRSGLKAYWRSKQTVKTDAITFTRAVFGKEASMTGFGDTVVDYSKMTNMPSDDAVGLLNALFRIAINDELPDWEREPSDRKKK